MPVVRWKTESVYVDIETGEKLTKKEYAHYIVINKLKSVYVDTKKSRGLITWTNECRRSPQLRLEW